MDAPDSLTAAAQGMRIQADSLSVIAENLANVSTAGFRAREAGFANFATELQTRVGLNSTQGPLRRTGVPTDLALSGPGYFAVATPNGVGYTRDGRMSVDPTGFLADAQGNRVLGALGPVKLPRDAHIEEDGTVRVAGRAIDRLRVVTFTRPCDIASSGGIFDAPPGCVPQRAPATVHAGYLEDSGVDAISQMTALIATQRAYEANEKSASQSDEHLRRVVTELPVVGS